MTHYTEEEFLEGCKVGNLGVVQFAINSGVDVNVTCGWALRRAVRYNKPGVWQQLLKHSNIKVNITNEYGLSALHTACRFNIPAAVKDLLDHPDILLNEKTMLGSSPLMVAAKYCNWEVLQMLLNDTRVDSSILDNMGRTIDQVIGVARTGTSKDVIKIVELIKAHPKKEIVSLATIEEKVVEEAEAESISTMAIQTNIVEGINELTKRLEDQNTAVTVSNQWLRRVSVTQLLEVQEKQMHQFELAQKLEFEKFETERGKKLALFQEEQEVALKYYVKNQETEMQTFSECLDFETETFNQKQIAELANLRERQRQENIEVQNELEAKTKTPNNLKNHLQNAIDHLQSKLTNLQQTEEVAHQDNSLLDSARKDLECPVCLEVMAPPVRIWQCETGHVICETCKDRVQNLMEAVYAKYCQHCQEIHSDKRSSEHKCSPISSPLGWKNNGDDNLSDLSSGVGSSISSSDFLSMKRSMIGFHSRRNSLNSEASTRTRRNSFSSEISGLNSPNNYGMDSPINQGLDSPNNYGSPSKSNYGPESLNNYCPTNQNTHGIASQRKYGVVHQHCPTIVSSQGQYCHNTTKNGGLASLSSWEGLPESLQEGVAICPTCKTAPFTGRNFALERISRTLFCVK